MELRIHSGKPLNAQPGDIYWDAETQAAYVYLKATEAAIDGWFEFTTDDGVENAIYIIEEWP